MQIIKFCYDNWSDLATITASSTNSDFPLSNLKHIWWSRAHRTTDHDHQWWKWNLGDLYEAGILATIFKYHNISSTAVVGLYGHDSDLGDDPAVWIAHGDTLKVPLVYGTDWDNKHIVKLWDDAQIYQWWLLSVDDPDNSDGYLLLGRPYLGIYFSPATNFNRGYSVRLIDPSRKRYSLGGQLSVSKLQTYRGVKYAWTEGNPLSYLDMIMFRTIFEDYVGQHTPYFICQDSDDKLNKTLYVENVSDWEIPHIQMDEFYGLTIEVKESQ